MAGSQLQKRPTNAVDRHEEPSEQWGWHGRFPRGRELGGWVSVVILFALAFIGNHIAWTERLWLVAIGALLVVGLIGDRIRKRTAWRR